MANKLTKKKLEELILEVLSESTQEYDIYITTVPMDITVDQWRALHQEGWDGTQQHNYAFSPKGSQLQDFLKNITTILKKYNVPVTSQGGLSPTNKSITNKIGGFLTVRKQFISEDDFKKFKTEAKDLLLKDRPEASVDDFRVKIYDSNTEKPIPDSTAYTSTPAIYDAATLDNLLAQVLASKNATELKTAKDNLTNYYTQFQADIDKDTARKTKYDNALVAKFKFDKTKFDKLYQDLVDASKLTDQTVVDNAKKAITDYYNSTGTKDSASDTKFANVTNFKAAFDLTAYSTVKAALDTEITNNNDEAKISKALADLKTYYNANKAEVDKADSNAAAEIADLETRATAAIDALKNVWKQDALGDVDPDFVLDPSKSYTDTDRQKILQALRDAFTGLLNNKQIKHLASLSESIVKEAASKLEIDDILSLYDKPPSDKFQGTTGNTNLEISKKIDSMLTTYINNLKDRDKAKEIFKAKKKFDAMIAKSRDLKPSETPEFSPTQNLPTTSQIGGDEKAPVDPVVFQSFEAFFSGKATIKDRLLHLKEFSNAVINKTLNSYSPEIIFTGGNVLSILSKMTRQMDASAAGYIAEAFLAFLVAGSKVGQTGGAADFKGPDGRLYSSKWGQTSKNQAKSNFKTAGETITYISAFKTTIGGVGTSKTMSVSKIELSIYDVFTTVAKTTARKGRPGLFGTRYPNNNVTAARKTKGEDVPDGTKSTDFDVSPPSSLSAANKFEIQFVTAADETFDQVFNEAMKNVTDDLAKAAAEFNSKSKQLNELTTTYTVSGDFSEGVAMAQTYADIKGILQRVSTEKGFASADIGLTENKNKSLKDLDKLIERVILNKMLIK